ncbi:alpha/beta hydrolase [Leucobacter sp. GX24907]
MTMPPELQEPDPDEAAHDDDPRGRRSWRRKGWGPFFGIIALVVAVALAGYGLLPLFTGGGSDAEGTPSSEPGPLPEEPAGSIESFGQQQPNWAACDEGMLCAEVYAPLDWDDPAGERISLRLVKHEAAGDALGTLFVNPGGPGVSAVDYLMRNIDGAVTPEVKKSYDVVTWDPRGVGASTAVECADSKGLDEYLFGRSDTDGLEAGSDEWIEVATAEAEAFGEACAERSGDLIKHVDTLSTVHDLDMLRSIVGDAHLNYLGFSYGTYIGSLYADTFPEKVGRLVLDGVMDPTSTANDVVLEQTKGFENALRAYLEDCLGRSDCPFTGTVDQSVQQIGDLLTQVEEHPLQGRDGRWVTSRTMITAIITPLYSKESWNALDQLFTSIAQGDPDTAFWLADFYYDRVDGEYRSNSNEAFAAINCLDRATDPDPERMRQRAAELAAAAPIIGPYQGYVDISCVGWPGAENATQDPPKAAGAGPILLVGTAGDPATPYRWAESVAEQLESGVLVTYEGEGHIAYGENDCIDAVIDDYLLNGAVPAGDPRCSA